jgi:hypothetical protein
LPEEVIVATAKIMENTSFSITHVEEMNTLNSNGERNEKKK